MGNQFCAKHPILLVAFVLLLLENVPHSSSKVEMPTILKIFQKAQPNDGYENLRSFARDMTSGVLHDKQLLNTSIAFTSPLFSFQLPSTSSTEEGTIKMANQIIFGMFALLTTVLVYALPVLLTGQRFNPNARSNEDEGIIGNILKSEPLARLLKEGVHKEIGLEPEKCMQKTICQAHRSPRNKEFGMMALPFQMFYPPPPKDSDKKSRAASSSYQKAAYIGKYTSTSCAQKYNCFFDVLDLGRYLVDWYQYHYPGVESSSGQQ